MKRLGTPVQITQRQYHALIAAVCLLDVAYDGDVEPKEHTADRQACQRVLRVIANSLREEP